MIDDTYGPVPDSVRSTIALVHISALAGLVSGIGFFAGPLVLWLIKRDEHPAIDAAGKEAVNFHLTMLIAWMVAIVLCFVLIGIPLLFVIGAAEVIFPIVAAVKASNGETYRYPVNLRLIK